jgi:hypothetical protein
MQEILSQLKAQSQVRLWERWGGSEARGSQWLFSRPGTEYLNREICPLSRSRSTFYVIL